MKSFVKILVVTVVALAIFVFVGKSENETEVSVADTTTSNAKQAEQLEEIQVSSDTPASELAVNNELADAKVDTLIRENRIEENKLEWRKVTPEFKEFMELTNKPLMSIADKDRLSQLMYETKLVEASRKILLRDVNEKELDLVHERKRLDAIEYLTTVLVGKYNSPQLDNAKDLALEALYHDNVKPEQDTDLKRSLVGDKVELGMVLAVYHEDAWESYKENATHSDKQAKFVEYVDQMALVKAEQLSNNALKLAQRLKKIKEE
ncbi:hypothetical protein A7985_13295 [Pseudoalteromonas luteoviolacea]|uniref:Uncharacterized protein n=1 Tax=Pseudoalteromonas luteoviolacea TaxID=43657 RepID=A0A1C0TPD6_9GAMM|nr:hypothetical protein [Pseudoalteromonas luteoviolacea]MBQ4811729.1 hypothetical protein [Pseudoalteromonas luteoviolacea]OCQ20773.1 hypothetical protein A7985_13295 [Pseudoalteromonas luteoviolacea]